MVPRSPQPARLPARQPRGCIRRLIFTGFVVVLVLGAVIQLIPYGRDHTNPPVRTELAWDSPGTRALFVRGCADCHSNETVWPWYSNIAPMSWLVTRDVEEGRDKFNVSEWDRSDNEEDDAVETVQEGSMPPSSYTMLHPSARFSPEEQRALIAGLQATFGDQRDDDEEEED